MAYPNLYKFKIDEKIGERLCYTLYRATDQTTQQTVFLKLLNETHSRHETSVYHFLNNAQILQSLEHPGLRKIYQYGTDLNYYYIAVEPLELEPLQSLIQDEFSLSSQDLIEIFSRICTTLRQAHLAGVVHGVLNPRSIYIGHDGSIKLDDLGLSWYATEALKFSSEESLYLAQYIAPELAKDAMNVDGRSDIYSLGAIMTHLIAGRPPFSGGSISIIQEEQRSSKLPELNLGLKDLPEELEGILTRALNIHPDSRFHNIKELVSSLKSLKKETVHHSYAGTSEAEEFETVNFEPDENADPFVEETPDTEKKITPPVFAETSEEEAATLGGFLASRQVRIVSAAVFGILLLVVAIFNLPLFDSSETPGQPTEAPLKSNVQPPGIFLPGQENESVRDDDMLIEEIEGETPELVDGDQPEQEDWNPFNDPDSEETEMTPEETDPVDNPTADSPPTPEPKPENKNIETTTTTATVAAATPKSNTKPAKPETKPQASQPEPAKTKDEPQASTQMARATFKIQSQNEPIEAFVFINDRFKGKSDSNGTLVVKDLKANTAYTVRVSREGFSTVTKRFSASLDNPTVLEFDISPKKDIYATLVLDVSPSADSILVDGKQYRGQTPLKLTLPWGEHRVRFVNNRLKKSWDQVVNLKVGQIVRVKHDFSQSEVGKVAISLKNASEFGFAFVYVDGKPWPGRPNTTPVEIELPAGAHTLEVRRDGFSAIPRDIIVTVEKAKTKYVSFTLTKNP